jgi:hypothetical protein
MKRKNLLAAWALGLIVLASASFPGDAQLLDDEPNLLHRALYNNSTPSQILGISLPFTVASRGLLGTRGVDYGPLPTWIYQLFLLFTHNPVAMVAVRAILVNAATAIALYWLTKTINVSSWLAVAVMLSPWLWLYSRQLWDNSFCIPLCAISIAAYADFLAQNRAGTLALAAVSGLAGILVHLMAVALVIPLALHFFIFRRNQIWRFTWSLVAVTVIFAALGFPYFHYLLSQTHPTVSHAAPIWKGLIYPLFGAHLLSAAGIQDCLGPGWFYTTGWLAYPLTIAYEISLLMYPLVWLGIILAIPRAFRPTSTVNHLSLLCLAILLCQCVLDALARAYDYPHYYNATWIIFAFFALLAADFLWRHFHQRALLSRVAFSAYALSLVFLIAVTAATIHRNGGSRNLAYGITLADQRSACQTIAKYSPDVPPLILIEQWQKYPGDMKVLAELNPPTFLVDPLPRQKLIVRYRDAFPGDAHILVEVRPL